MMRAMITQTWCCLPWGFTRRYPPVPTGAGPDLGEVELKSTSNLCYISGVFSRTPLEANSSYEESMQSFRT